MASVQHDPLLEEEVMHNHDPLDVGLDSRYVAVTGDTMTGTLNFSSAGITNAESVTYDITQTRTPIEGETIWNDDAKTLEVGLKGGFPLEIGLQQVELCVNKTGSSISKGKVVYINGGQGNRPTITLADNSTDATSARTFGVTVEAINDNNSGYVVSSGIVIGLDTNAYTAGTQLYLSTSGNMTSTKPVAPAHMVYVAKVLTQSTTVGAIHVGVTNGFEIDELHDVLITSLANKDTIAYDSTSSLWKNKSLATLKTDLDLTGTNSGDVTVTDTSTIDFTLTGQALTGSVIQSGISHNNLSTLQGGKAPNEYNHLSNAQMSALHDAVTVLDTSTIDLTLTDQLLEASVIEGGITHNNLGSLQGGTAGQYNHLTNAQVSALHDAITVTDTTTIDFTLTGQALTGSVIQAGITHNNLGGLTTGDPHTQYALLAGRSGGQTLSGGTAVNNQLTLRANTASGNTSTNQAARLLVGDNGSILALSSTFEGRVSVPVSLAVGGTPALSGELRLSNNQFITVRNQANTADIDMIKVNASNNIQFGGGIDLGNQAITGVYSIAQFTSSNWSFNNVGVGYVGSTFSIGTTSAPNTLSFGNAGNNSIGIVATASGTVGRTLTILAGDTTAGGSNIAGGSLLLEAGVGTGTGASNIIFYTGASTGTATTLQTLTARAIINNAGRLGIGDFTSASPSFDLSFSNSASKTVGIETTASGTVGRGLTIAAGSTVANTNIAGGSLTLNAGLASGTGTSNIVFQTGQSAASGVLQTLTTRLTIDNAGDFTFADGVDFIVGSTNGTKFATATTQKIGFYNATPIVRPSAYTQTFATADKTMAARTAAALTNNTGGTVSTTLAAITAGATYTQADMLAVKNALASLADQVNKIRTDDLDTANVVNSIVDDLQALGLVG
jgi:hypothetical protein